MILQLKPPLWLDTPKGEGICHFLIDPGIEMELLWVIFIHSTGEAWTFSNVDIRIIENVTLRRGKPMAHWIAKATKNKGGLHKSLGIAKGKKIPEKKIAAAAKKGGKVGKQARLAQTLSGLRKKG